jgi:hypothetical protein
VRSHAGAAALRQDGVKLTTLRKDRANDIGVKPEGPFKNDHDRY